MVVQVTDFQKTKPSVFLIDDERQLVLEMINKFKFDRFAAESKYGLSIGANIAKWLVEAGIVEREEHADVSGQKYVHYIINRRRLDMALGRFTGDDLKPEQESTKLDVCRSKDIRAEIEKFANELDGTQWPERWSHDEVDVAKKMEQIRGDRHVFAREYVQQPINPESVRKAREISETALREQDAFIYTMTAMRDAYMDGFFKFDQKSREMLCVPQSVAAHVSGDEIDSDGLRIGGRSVGKGPILVTGQKDPKDNGVFKFDQKSGQWSRLTSGRLCSCGQPAMLDSDLCADCRTIAEESTTTAPANPQHPDNFGDWISRPVGYPGEPYIRTTPKPSSEVIAWNQPLKRDDR